MSLFTSIIVLLLVFFIVAFGLSLGWHSGEIFTYFLWG